MILDISHYQGSIDWDALAPELEFVILRATVGMAKDNRYIEYSDNCVARGDTVWGVSLSESERRGNGG